MSHRMRPVPQCQRPGCSNAVAEGFAYCRDHMTPKVVVTTTPPRPTPRPGLVKTLAEQFIGGTDLDTTLRVALEQEPGGAVYVVLMAVVPVATPHSDHWQPAGATLRVPARVLRPLANVLTKLDGVSTLKGPPAR